jgi:hypothetical protein
MKDEGYTRRGKRINVRNANNRQNAKEREGVVTLTGGVGYPVPMPNAQCTTIPTSRHDGV